MAARLTNTVDVKFTIVMCVAIMIFVMLVAKHYEITTATVRALGRDAGAALAILGAQSGVRNPCAADETLVVFSPTVYICDVPQNPLVYEEIYRFYPSTADGREIMYSFMDEGNKSRADEMLENIYDLERYPASTFTTPLTWTEDPYDERYWRFLFYSLRPLRHLIATANETSSERYYEKIREITGSFMDTGMSQPHSWDDAHGVAFRTMMLVNVWWKLREAGELPSDLSDKILASLEVHGDFLLDPNNYEDDYNHAITQSAALLLLAESFPDLANASTWKETALRRLDITLSSIIDPNGVLVENSPYYHFYVLEKYWEIYNYTKRHSITVSDNFADTIERMVHFSTHILTPNLSVPLLGASSPRTFNRSGEYREIAESFRTFDYVMTKGDAGSAPKETNILFPSSGIAIMRSGWGTDRSFTDEAQVVFDTGPYRTDHSDLDVLTFSLYAAGIPVIRDTGLFTYETEHALYDYFHGTRGHNTVMVDDQSQPEGTGTTEDIQTMDGISYVSAAHELYPDVRHSRAIAMINPTTFLVVDDLRSASERNFEQLFHLNEGAAITAPANPLVATIASSSSNVALTITQLSGNPSLTLFKEQYNPVRGLCAGAYEVTIPCYELSYATRGTSARFVTLITAEREGARPASATYDEGRGTVTVTTPQATHTIALTYPGSGLIDETFIELSIQTNGAEAPNVRERIQQLLNRFF